MDVGLAEIRMKRVEKGKADGVRGEGREEEKWEDKRIE